nr:Domain of uncharacterised function (DUF1889) [Klebsiella pneumoniae]
MPAVIDKALDFIGGMNTSEPVPQSMDESTAKGILKYLKNWAYQPPRPTSLRAANSRAGALGLPTKWRSGLNGSPPANGW